MPKQAGRQAVNENNENDSKEAKAAKESVRQSGTEMNIHLHQTETETQANSELNRMRQLQAKFVEVENFRTLGRANTDEQMSAFSVSSESARACALAWSALVHEPEQVTSTPRDEWRMTCIAAAEKARC